MKYKINGTVLQAVDIDLEKGESVFCEGGGMSWMTTGIDMETSTRGGIMKGIGRLFSGESFFLTTYKCSEDKARVTFSSEFPGKIIPVELKEGDSIICQKDAFMAGEDTVNLEVYFKKKLGAGLFGGEGFILQKASGPGTCFFEVSGEVVEYDLKEGEVLKVDPGHIAMFEPGVEYDITTVKGVKNIFFSGEGLFLATLKGPGKVWLQTMPLRNLALKLIPFLPIKRQ